MSDTSTKTPEVAELQRQVRLEKKKTLDAFRSNVRIFQLTEKVRSAYESTAQLAKAHNTSQLLDGAVRLLCDPAGFDYKSAAVYLVLDRGLVRTTSQPSQPSRALPPKGRERLEKASRLTKPGKVLILPLVGEGGLLGYLEVRFHRAEEVRSWQENILRTFAEFLALMAEHLQGRAE